MKSHESNHSDENQRKKQFSSLAAVRKAHTFNVLEMCDGCRAKAAEILGMSEKELRRQIKTLDIACVNGKAKKGANRNRLSKGGRTDE